MNGWNWNICGGGRAHFARAGFEVAHDGVQDHVSEPNMATIFDAMAPGEISWKAQGLTPVGILAELALTPSNLPSIDARVAALQALVEPARQGDDGAISALAGSMQDWHAKIRQTALEALSEALAVQRFYKKDLQ
eukprot:symbB.v1.2.031720.t1/scaffold3714.1/size51563/7